MADVRTSQPGSSDIDQPTDAALIDLYWKTTGDNWAIPDHVMVEFGRAVLDRFARTPHPVQVEVTDDMVERAARALFEPPSVGVDGEYTWAEMVAEDPIRADLWRTDARAILVAALGGGDTQHDPENCPLGKSAAACILDCTILSGGEL